MTPKNSHRLELIEKKKYCEMLTEEESLKWFNNLISEVAKEIIVRTNKNKDKLDKLIIITRKS